MSIEPNSWMKFKDSTKNRDILTSEASPSKRIPEPSQRSQSEFGRSSQKGIKSSPASTSKPKPPKKKSKYFVQ